MPFLAFLITSKDKGLLQENYDILSRCIKENLGFKDGKPVAACVIYRCLLHWHAFESERTSIFDFIIERINEVLKVIFAFEPGTVPLMPLTIMPNNLQSQQIGR